MQPERDRLVKQIFPQLREYCADRGVGITEVDLRWGVTQEQAERGEVLPICLAEIENCRPYFIGLLGDRYGWVPDTIPDIVVEENPWLSQYRGKSITELEIVHGVLNHPERIQHGYFYFRRPSPTSLDFSDETHKEKLTSLKERIRQSNFPVREDYPDAETLGQLVLEDLQKAIDEDFPPRAMSRFERERLDHDAFAESRKNVYIKRRAYFEKLDSHARGTGAPLVLEGQSGIGKSALLANWLQEFQENHPDVYVLAHFTGSTASSSNHLALIRRIIAELQTHFNLNPETAHSTSELLAQFQSVLSVVASKSRVVLIIDGLDQLEDTNNAHSLDWLPVQIPPEIRLIVSSLPGNACRHSKKDSGKNWSYHHLTSISEKH